MKFMIPVLIAAFVAALLGTALAQSQSGQAGGAPGVAPPKTTEVMVIVTPTDHRPERSQRRRARSPTSHPSSFVSIMT